MPARCCWWSALAAQFLADFGASALRYAIARGASFSSQLRETAWVYVIDAALSGVGLLVAKDIESSPEAVLALVPLLGVLAMFARERHERMQSLLELSSAYRGTALVLGDVVAGGQRLHRRALQERRRAGAGGRATARAQLRARAGISSSPRCCTMSARSRSRSRSSTSRASSTRTSGLIIKTHTIEGQKMLDRVGGFMHEVGLIVRSHHERWDGAGYPDGLAGEAIPLEARIIACCDSWNAMRTDRVYRKALSYDAALTELITNRGAQFDPRIVEALRAIVGLEPVGRTARRRESQRRRAAPPARSNTAAPRSPSRPDSGTRPSKVRSSPWSTSRQRPPGTSSSVASPTSSRTATTTSRSPPRTNAHAAGPASSGS